MNSQVRHLSHTKQSSTKRHAAGNILQRVGGRSVDLLGTKGSSEVFRPRDLRRIGGVVILSALSILGMANRESAIGRAKQDVVGAVAYVPDMPGAVGRRVTEFLHDHSTEGQAEEDLNRLRDTPKDQVRVVSPIPGQGSEAIAERFTSDPNQRLRIQSLIEAEHPVEGHPGLIRDDLTYQVPDWLIDEQFRQDQSSQAGSAR